MKETFKKIITKKKIIILFFQIISAILMSIGVIISNAQTSLIALIILFLCNIMYGILYFKNEYLFLLYNITFFVLLFGKKVVLFLSGKSWYEEFGDKVECNTLLLLYLSLIFIYCGTKIYNLYIKKKKVKNKIEKPKNEKEIKTVRLISLVCFYLTLVAALIVSIEQIIFVYKNGYLAVNNGAFLSKVPSIVHKISGMNIIFFIIYLCTFPSKKTTLINTIIYFTYSVITIFEGSRGDFVVSTLMLLLYYIYRQKELKEQFLNKKTIIIATILGFCMIIFLGLYNTIRNKLEIKDFNVFNTIKQFIIDQGTSCDVISYSQIYKDQLPEQNYTFSFFINYPKENIILKHFFNNEESINNSDKIYVALNGNNLGASISYLAIKPYYLQGYGLGTQYIAELYVDYSYIGVIIYNMLLGILMSYAVNVDKNNYIKTSLSIYLSSKVLYLPRQFAMTIAGYLCSFTLISCYVFIIVLSKLLLYLHKGGNNNEGTMDS